MPFSGVVRMIEKSGPSGLRIAIARLSGASSGKRSLSNAFGD